MNGTEGGKGAEGKLWKGSLKGRPLVGEHVLRRGSTKRKLLPPLSAVSRLALPFFLFPA